jgi:hypothetical protein
MRLSAIPSPPIIKRAASSCRGYLQTKPEVNINVNVRRVEAIKMTSTAHATVAKRSIDHVTATLFASSLSSARLIRDADGGHSTTCTPFSLQHL